MQMKLVVVLAIMVLCTGTSSAQEKDFLCTQQLISADSHFLNGLLEITPTQIGRTTAEPEHHDQ